MQLTRKIVQIDEEKCDGCGECVPSCHEGAIRIVNGKARLVSDNLCDGLGACLGHCPRGAITIEERPAEAFDEHAVEQHLHKSAAPPAGTAASVSAAHPRMHQAGCPGSRLQLMLAPPAQANPPQRAAGRTNLSQWPVQLALLPPAGKIWQDADVLVAADCVAFACPDFQQIVAAKRLAIACPKLDDVQPYLHKLRAIFANNSIRSVSVAHMEVPCCSGIVRLVQLALSQAGRNDLVVEDITVGIDGSLKHG